MGKNALVSSCGGMACAYGVGVGEAVQELSPDFLQDSVFVGSSGSTGMLAYYTANRRKYSRAADIFRPIRHIWEDLLSTPKFISFLRLQKIIDIDYLIDEVFRGQEPLNVEDYHDSPIECFIAATDVNKPASLRNYHQQLEELAQIKLAPEIEQNLQWQLNNHNQQGKQYAQAIKKAKSLPSFSGEEYFSRDQEVWTCYDATESGPYHKVQALICRQGERNVLTYIASNDKAIDFETISAILANDQTPEQQAEAISQHVKAEYIHLSKFKDGKKVAEPIGYN